MTSEEKRQKAQINRLMAKGPIDLPFALLVLLLTAIGVLMVFSASFARAFYEAEDPSAMAALSVFLRQAVFAAAGVVVMFITSKIDYHWWRRWAVPLLGLTILLLLAVIVLPYPIAITSNGATRWLNVGFTTFQPSEVAKFAVILYFAATISVKKDKMETLQDGIFPYFLILGVIVILMMKVWFRADFVYRCMYDVCGRHLSKNGGARRQPRRGGHPGADFRCAALWTKPDPSVEGSLGLCFR